MTIVRGKLSTLASSAAVTSLATSWAVNPTAGSTIIVWVQCNVASLTSVVDNGATQSTFTLDASQTTGGKRIFIYRANGITLPASGSYSVTASFSGTAGSMSLGGIEYSGIQFGGPSSTNSGTATSTSVSTSAVTALAPTTGLYFGAFSDASGLNPETITYTGSGTQQFVVTNGSSFWPCACADKIGSGSTAHTWTLGDSVSWGASIATYPAAQGAFLAMF